MLTCCCNCFLSFVLEMSPRSLLLFRVPVGRNLVNRSNVLWFSLNHTLYQHVCEKCMVKSIQKQQLFTTKLCQPARSCASSQLLLHEFLKLCLQWRVFSKSSHHLLKFPFLIVLEVRSQTTWRTKPWPWSRSSETSEAKTRSPNQSLQGTQNSPNWSILTTRC